MARKAPKIVLDVIVSAIVFLVLALLLDWLASLIFGKTVHADGSSTVKLNGGVLLAITTVLTITFAVWFYKFLTNHKVSRVAE
jgi:hypothetical protein